MAYKRILYLTDYALHVYHMHKTRIDVVDTFEANNLKPFTQYLLSDEHTPLHWIVDSVHEEYQLATIPHVYGSDRQNIIRHRLRRLFEQADFSHADIQERERKGRGDNHALFLALNKANLLQPWLDIITTYKIPLAGIYSIALLSKTLLRYFPKNPYVLLVGHSPRISEHSTQGLRHMFFAHKNLKLSRLTALSLQETSNYVENIVNQIVRTQRYLNSAQLLPNNATLPVIIVTDAGLKQVLSRYFERYAPANMVIQLLDQRQFAASLKLKVPDNQPLFLHHLVAHQLLYQWLGTNHYARFTDRRYFIYRRLRKTMYLTATLMLIVALGISGTTLYQALDVRAEGMIKEREINQLTAELRKLNLDNVGLTPDQLFIVENVVDTAKSLQAQQLLPQTLLLRVGQILNYSEFRGFSLEKLSWKINNKLLDVFPSKRNDLIKISADRFNPDVLDEGEFGVFWEGLHLSGTVYLQAEDYIRVLRQFRAWIRALKKYGANYWEVYVLKEPDAENTGGYSKFEIVLFVAHGQKNSN